MVRQNFLAYPALPGQQEAVALKACANVICGAFLPWKKWFRLAADAQSAVLMVFPAIISFLFIAFRFDFYLTAMGICFFHGSGW